MLKRSHLKLLLLLLLLTTGFCHAAARHGGQAAKPANGPCSDISKPPAIDCGLAPNAVFDSQGRLWAAWAFAGHVYVNHSDDRGTNFTPPVAVNRIPEPISARGENRPKIALGKAGKLFVTWTTPLEKRFTGHIRFSRSLDGGRSFSDPVTVNDNLDITSHRFEDITVNERGEITIAWLDKRDLLQAKKQGRPYKGAAVYYAVSDNDGESFHPNQKIIDNSCECCRVAVASDIDQLPVVLWRNIYGDSIRDHALVKFTRVNQAGTPVRVSYDEWHIDACPHHGPALSIAQDGIYHLTWFDNAEQRHGLFYARSEDQGASYSEAVNFGDYDKAASHPDIVSLGQRVFLAWKEYDGKYSRVLWQHSDNGGLDWSDPMLLAETEGESDYPFFANDGEQVFVYWLKDQGGFDLYPVAVTKE